MLNLLSDQDLLSSTKRVVQEEREILTKVLHHLREIERRRLFSELGYASLFEYAVKELRFSEGQAGRRLQAMRLIKEIPEVENKIASGELNLTNVSQAQSLFREMSKAQPGATVKKSEKVEILQKLENKSAREGQQVLLTFAPALALPKERERIINDEHCELRLVVTKELKEKLEEVRSLAGPKGASMSLAELFQFMAGVSIDG